MTRIGVVSDSHGSGLFLDEAAKALKGCNTVFHLGDYEEDAEYLCAKGLHVISVSGNCDGHSFHAVEKIQECEGIRIFLTHGHKYSVKFSLLRLKLQAQQESCAIALYGHTHIARCDYDEGVLLLNPGALQSGRYAEIVIDETGIHPELKRFIPE